MVECTQGGYNLAMEPSIGAHDESALQPSVPASATPRRSTSYAHDKAKILTRLRRLEGQVRGVQRMVEQDQYCVDVLTQLSAIVAAARGAGLLVLEDHIRGCVLPPEPNRPDDASRQDVIDELTDAIARFTRAAG